MLKVHHAAYTVIYFTTSYGYESPTPTLLGGSGTLAGDAALQPCLASFLYLAYQYVVPWVGAEDFIAPPSVH